jgi:hypothetical protein
MKTLRFVSIFALACAHHSIAEQPPTTTQSSYDLAAYITYAQSWIPSWSSSETMMSNDQLLQAIDAINLIVEDSNFINQNYEFVLAAHNRLNDLQKNNEKIYAAARANIEVKTATIENEKNSILQKLTNDYDQAYKKHQDEIAQLQSDEEKQSAIRIFNETCKDTYDRSIMYADRTRDRKIKELEDFDLSYAKKSYASANELLYKIQEIFDAKNQKAIINTQIQYNEKQKHHNFDEIISTEQQPGFFSGMISNPYYYAAPFKFQGNENCLKCTGCIMPDGSVNNNIPHGSARQLITSIALHFKNSQAEDGFHHSIGIQNCIKYKNNQGIQLYCQTMVDDFNRAAYEEMLEHHAKKNKKNVAESNHQTISAHDHQAP